MASDQWCGSGEGLETSAVAIAAGNEAPVGDIAQRPGDIAGQTGKLIGGPRRRQHDHQRNSGHAGGGRRRKRRLQNDQIDRSGCSPFSDEQVRDQESRKRGDAEEASGNRSASRW